MSKIIGSIFLAAACLFCAAYPAVASEKLNVVASTTLLGDLVRKIGGDRVEVKTVAPPKFNVHFIQPRPSDVRNVAKADLYVFQGLDLEAWSDPLVEAAGKPDKFRGGPRSLDVSSGVRLIEVPEGPLSRAEGDIHLFGNPHYSMNPENALIVARNISQKLTELDSAGGAEYEKNLFAFQDQLRLKIAAWKTEGANCVGKEIVSYHNDIVYFANFLGVKTGRFVEPKPGIPPTPRHLEQLEKYMSESGVHVIALSFYHPRSDSEALAKRAGGKTVLLAQNVGEVSGTDDFFAFFEYNVKALAEALKK